MKLDKKIEGLKQILLDAIGDDKITQIQNKTKSGISVINDVASILKNKVKLKDKLLKISKEINQKQINGRIEYYGVSYVSDYCINDCPYCGHNSSTDVTREILTETNLKKDLIEVTKFGPPDICILAGEHPIVNPDYLILSANKTLESDKLHSLDRITFNVAPMDVDDFRKIRNALNIELQFRIFQETYDKDIYNSLHKNGPKSDYTYRLEGQERALKGGFNKVGIGSLIGLNDIDKPYENFGNDFEILALVCHAEHLKEMFGQLPYSLSIPRIKQVEGSDFKIPKEIDDETYLLYHSILKLALPETRLIITCRETKEMRDSLRPFIGIEDLAVRPGVGGNYRDMTHLQNILGDTRNSVEIVNSARQCGYKPIIYGI